MKRLFCTSFLLLPLLINAQNLVRNGGFEAATSPAISNWPKENPPGTKVVDGWVTPTPATPDYYNSDASTCDGFPIALAQAGEGRCGVICGMDPQLPGVTNYKEYLQGELTEPLKAGKKYNVRFLVTLDCSSEITSTGIGAYFSPDAVRRQSKEKLNVQPQVISYRKLTYADGWTEISGSFTAAGGEKFITIGSFSDTAYIPVESLGQKPMTFFASPHIRQNAYFYVDAVCVSPVESDACECKKEEAVKTNDHFYLFVLDVSNSMNESGKLKQMKKQVRRFSDSLGPGNRVGIMTFSDHTSMPLPFTSPSEKDYVAGVLKKMEAGGSTNGELAIRKLIRLLDSLQLPGHCHVIMATDGIFQLGRTTKAQADSCFIRNQASFSVIQFGENKNADLEEISHTVPESSYHLATKKTLAGILDEQLPEEQPEAPSKKEKQPVYYTSLSFLGASEFIKIFIQSNPGDRFEEIPRK